ncbi:MAG: hypothetical protein QOE64_927 [Frankiales bacterium]|jgi:phage shock protein PspC (stress-responsive transcriptional regulator)|nr:hypothetical protein [Frankiales bacterium]
MTTTHEQPSAPRLIDARLRRPLDGRVFRGVCAAMGRYTNTDPVLWRVITAVTAVFGGAGIVLYLAGWLLIPEEGSDESIAERRGLGRLSRSAGLAVIAVILALALVAVLDHGSGLALLAVLAVLGWAAWRHGKGAPVPAFLAWTAPQPTGVVPSAPMAAHDVATPAAVWVPPVRTRRVRNGRLSVATMSLAAIVTGALLALRASGSDIDAVQVLAADVVVVGAGLVAGAFLGRPRLLVTLGLLLTLATGVTAGASTALHDGVGTRTWVPSLGAPTDYRLGSGEATLDLTTVARQGRPASYDVRLGFGHLIVIVPAGAAVTVDAATRFGDITGVGSDASGERVRRTGVVGGGFTPIALHIRMTAGQIEVRRG